MSWTEVSKSFTAELVLVSSVAVLSALAPATIAASETIRRKQTNWRAAHGSERPLVDNMEYGPTLYKTLGVALTVSITDNVFFLQPQSQFYWAVQDGALTGVRPHRLKRTRLEQPIED